jgi:6-phosphogluconolactonase (cycloisomerase 2 family)
MLTPRRLSAIAATTAAATFAAAAGSAVAHPSHHGRGQLGGDHFVDGHFGGGPFGGGHIGGGLGGPAGEVFVQTDNPAGNAVAVYDRSQSGTLSAAGTYATGGNGGVQQGSVVDHVASQGSLAYDGDQRELFAVNAGSNTISAFDVSGDRLHLKQVIGSGGSFPSSITVHGDLVYVLNALNGGTIQGYRLLGGYLLPIPGSSRSLNLDPNATPQFTSTPGQIAFSPDGRDLIVTTKANTNAIDVFPVNLFGEPSSTPVVNSEPGAVPFAVTFTGDDQLAVGEAGPNAVASFDLRGNGTLQPVSSVATGGTATCWVLADGQVVFAGNAGSNTESSVLSSPSGGLTLGATTNTDGGTVDATTSPDGRYLYVQAGAAGIVDEFLVGPAGALTEVGSVTVPNAVGGEGIAAS